MLTHQQARIAKSLWLRHYREHFLATLEREIAAHRAFAELRGMRAGFRLNGASDFPWERWCDVSGGGFYDYTKAPARTRPATAGYHLTYSLSERPESMSEALAWLGSGRNAAIVVRDRALAEECVGRGLYGFGCVDGDETDARFDDPPAKWVVLYAKGAARKDSSGFVRDRDALTFGGVAP